MGNADVAAALRQHTGYTVGHEQPEREGSHEATAHSLAYGVKHKNNGQAMAACRLPGQAHGQRVLF